MFMLDQQIRENPFNKLMIQSHANILIYQSECPEDRNVTITNIKNVEIA